MAIGTRVRILSVNVSLPLDLGGEGGEAGPESPWKSGIYKRPVADPVWLGDLNLTGDGQADLKSHGGPDRTVCVYPHEHYPAWMRELGLSELPYASFGENFTITGLLEDDVCIGDTFAVGEAVVQVTQPRLPCWKLARRFNVKDMAVRLRVTGRVGWHLRTIRTGLVQVGQELELVERHHDEWPVSRALEVIIHARQDRESAVRLSQCPHLSAYQKRALADPSSVPERREMPD